MGPTTVQTDYLVIGAGAAGLAFVDALVAESGADVVIVDRRDRPGGHWNNAYEFVRLHQPSAFYGVNSMSLGQDGIDAAGPNAGFYEQATAAEICTYFQTVMDSLLATGRVRFFGRSDYTFDRADGHSIRALDTGVESTVKVRRRLVDATYQESAIPSTHAPGFDIGDGAAVMPVNALAQVPEADGFTILGAGKTAMDACAWLLNSGVPADAIQWIKPRDSWILDRANIQPLDLLTTTINSVSLQLEAAAEAATVGELFERLEGAGQLIRLDPEVEPTMYHCGTLSRNEVTQLTMITDVVRLGRVRRIGRDRIDLGDGSVPTTPGRIHVDCTAAGLPTRPLRPVFEDGRVTPQPIAWCQPCFAAAAAGHVEAAYTDDATKNRLCPSNPYPNSATDWLQTTAISQQAQNTWGQEPELYNWMQGARLNAARGLNDHLGEPAMVTAIERMLTHAEVSVTNLNRLAMLTPVP